ITGCVAGAAIAPNPSANTPITTNRKSQIANRKFNPVTLSSLGVPMLPIVLHHGLLGFTDVGFRNFKLSYFRRIDRALEDLGHPLIIPSVHPTGGIELRARQLKTQILRHIKKLNRRNEKV